MTLYIDAEERAAFERESRELVPRRLVQGMFALMIVSLALVSFSVLTDQPHAGRVATSPVVAERVIVITGHGDAVRVTDADGVVVLDTHQGGFIAAVRTALTRKRAMAGIQGNPPLTLARHDNGRLTLTDPATGWRGEMTQFGKDSEAAFAGLLH